MDYITDGETDGAAVPDMKMFKGLVGKALLTFIQNIPHAHIRKIQARLKAKHCRIEPQLVPILPTRPSNEHGIYRTRTGYVYR